MTGALQLVEPGTGRQLTIPITWAPNPAPWDAGTFPGEAFEVRHALTGRLLGWAEHRNVPGPAPWTARVAPDAFRDAPGDAPVPPALCHAAADGTPGVIGTAQTADDAAYHIGHWLLRRRAPALGDLTGGSR